MKSWNIIQKDLKLLFRDRRALVTLVVLPMIFITIIGLTTGQLMGWNAKNQLVRIALADTTDYEKFEAERKQAIENERPVDALRIAQFKNATAVLFNKVQQIDGYEVHQAKSPEEAIRMQEDGTTSFAMILGPEFQEKLWRLTIADTISSDSDEQSNGFESLDIQFISNDPDSNTHQLVEKSVFSVMMRALIKYPLCRNRFIANTAGSVCDACVEEATEPAVELAPRNPPPPPDNRVYQELIPGFTVMFVFFLVNIMARSFIHERDLGTLRRLRMAPIQPASLLVGKTVPFFIISLIQTALLFIFGRLLFGMDWGAEPWMIIPVILCTSIAATALGLLIATIVQTDSQVSAYANFVVITLAGISGCFMPRDWLPDMMKQVSLWVPHSWSLIAYNQLLTEKVPDTAVVWQSCLMLLVFGLVFFVLGCFRFRKVD